MMEIADKAQIVRGVTKERIRVAMHEAFDKALQRTSVVQMGAKWVLLETDPRVGGIVKTPDVTNYETKALAGFAVRDKALKAAFVAAAPLVEKMTLQELFNRTTDEGVDESTYWVVRRFLREQAAARQITLDEDEELRDQEDAARQDAS